jgi:hypothetical protein
MVKLCESKMFNFPSFHPMPFDIDRHKENASLIKCQLIQYTFCDLHISHISTRGVFPTVVQHTNTAPTSNVLTI